MRVHLSGRFQHDDGAVAVTVAILAIVLIGLAAFTLDFGMAYAQRRALSTGADSAALAIVRQSYDKVIKDPSLTCNQLKTSGEAAASVTALTQINANAPYGDALASTAVQSPILDCVGPTSGTLQATVSVSKSIDTFFGGIFGVSTLDLNRTAAAALGVVNGVSGYLPIGVCTWQAQEIVKNGVVDANKIPPETRRREKIELNKVWKPGNDCAAGGSGNWGWLFCDGGGVPDLADAITNGCPEPLVLVPGSAGPPVVPPHFMIDGVTGDKGNSTGVSTAMSGRMDDVVAIPVYDSVTGPGGNATFRVIGFLSVRLCAYSANKEATPGACYRPGIDPVSGLDVTVDKKADALQVQYVAYTPAADFSALCNLGDKTCAFNAYVTKLIR